MPAPRFIKFKLQDPKKSTRDNNPFYVRKALHGIAGKVRSGTQLNNGVPLVEVFNEKQAVSLSKVKQLTISSHLVHVERHSDLCLRFSEGLLVNTALKHRAP
jgi:hypothetical protein